ncbi:hypothetical protein SynBIOSU31_00563 [Synechococcus sp. BIOS-U3-1]|uniref:hypothetical protein n=1 Tax=Synechococcus sp. BIOS-U3-1 TaxID=1400865 RepID=UPI0016464D7A|nr:hypothetical protein [Synechococcus sp. BIOS-U3-1]QNI57464.1 hypothetical protein SynBIOSU31_00563 [Synechococcus sp. BIOS-U3-1]|tara:strand:+ start:951 stop:1187 length:237 start_codon:yes stop_codon:yes gene_type:complete
MTDQPPEQAPTVEELQESIDELSAYRDRLYNDVLGLGKKLRLSQKKIDATLSEHPELTRIDEVLNQLKSQRNAQSSSS